MVLSVVAVDHFRHFNERISNFCFHSSSEVGTEKTVRSTPSRREGVQPCSWCL